jgi:hypothetical protein
VKCGRVDGDSAQVDIAQALLLGKAADKMLLLLSADLIHPFASKCIVKVLHIVIIVSSVLESSYGEV